MRYIAGTLYGLAAAQGSGLLFNSVGIGVCVAIGTVALVFALEGIIRHELWKRTHAAEDQQFKRARRRPF